MVKITDFSYTIKFKRYRKPKTNMKTIKTNIHHYSFPLSDAKGYMALCDKLSATHKSFQAIPSLTDERTRYTNSVEPVELETKCLFNNQWNTPTARVFDWFDAAAYRGRTNYSGHWLEITEEMEQVRRETLVCGYCGSHYGPHHEEHGDIPEEGFCTKCLSSEYLKETEIYLLRLQPVSDQWEVKRAPLTEEEAAWLKPLYVDTQIEGDKQRIEGEKKASIAEVVKKYDTATIEYGGMMWLLERGFSIRNVIFYSHTEVFKFGWRQPLSEDVKREYENRLKGFPFKFEIA